MSELIEFNKGDRVKFSWGLDKRTFKVALKPKFKNRVLYLTLEDDEGVRRECLAQWCEHAE